METYKDEITCDKNDTKVSDSESDIKLKNGHRDVIFINNCHYNIIGKGSQRALAVNLNRSDPCLPSSSDSDDVLRPRRRYRIPAAPLPRRRSSVW